MNVTIRIKFSENLDDQAAMTKAGGMIVVPRKGKNPMFSFPTEFHYRQYLTYRREMKNALGGNQGR
ncbi:hypothetical protein HMSSN139_26650 [Paenibacillus sp. HMSSN-139]|nr:hypothetical protein HMSSN139_26650 [Paenibacillus sp. HMSSN-139]